MKLSLPIISLLIVLAIIVLFFVIPSVTALGTLPNEEKQKNFEKSKQYDPQKEAFVNRARDAYENMNKRMKFDGGFLKFLLGDDNNEWPPEPGLPLVKPDLQEFLKASEEIKVIWFGHSTFLLNFHGTIVLVDPVFSDHASPVPVAIKRFQKTPLGLEEMPEIDYILISHDHYDHLDVKAMKYFKKVQKTRFIVPLGVSSHLLGWGIQEDRIDEFDWWQSGTYGDLQFIATPAQHFSGRSFNDRNKTLWAGWIIKGKDHSLFFSGDTGYDNHFKEIGERYGDFDIAFIENGQYNKMWEEVHLLPEQAVQAFYDLKAQTYFPVHWGAFKISIHSWYEPIEKVYQYSLERGFPLIAPQIGEIVTVNKNYVTQTWWKKIIEKGN